MRVGAGSALLALALVGCPAENPVTDGPADGAPTMDVAEDRPDSGAMDVAQDTSAPMDTQLPTDLAVDSDVRPEDTTAGDAAVVDAAAGDTTGPPADTAVLRPDTGPDGPEPPRANVLRGGLTTLGPRTGGVTLGNVFDDGFEAGGRMCVGTTCVTGTIAP